MSNVTWKSISPLSPDYWKSAASEVKNPKMLALAALFIALNIVLASFFIPVGESLRIYFTFFVKALGAMIYGPVLALYTGFIGDILGYVIHPTGPFFFGYTISSMLGAMVYGLFFYRARIGVVRIAVCKLTVNLFVNVLLGSLWSAMLYGKGYYFYFVKSTIKNITLLPFEVLTLLVFFQIMIPILASTRLFPNIGQIKNSWLLKLKRF